MEFITQYNTPFIKIPSAKLTDYTLLKEAVKLDKTIILSTGMSTLDEIDNAVEILKHNDDFILMHCNSNYPAPLDELNLLVIPYLKYRYNCRIGYSGHEYGVEPTVIAAVLGAEYIERHITLDHDMWGSDHSVSLEVAAMDILKRRISSIPVIFGNGVKIVTDKEKEILKKLRNK